MGECASAAGLERTRFFARQLVAPDDLTQDQIYFREKLRRHNRLLHGWGVVCGARVRKGQGDCQVDIEPGYLLGPFGDEIVIDRVVTVDLCRETQDGDAACDPPMDPWCSDVRACPPADRPVYLAVRYAECRTRPVRAYPAGCGCDDSACEYSRIRDSFAVKVLTRLPATYSDPMTPPDFADLLRCEPDGECSGRPCPPCPAEPWVILADVTFTRDCKIDRIDCFSHRRHVVSFANFYFLCRGQEPPPPPAAHQLRLQVDPGEVKGGENAKGFLTIAPPAPAGGLTVQLSHDTNAIASMPTSLTIAANANTGSFPIATNHVRQKTTVNVTATLGPEQRTALLVVIPEVVP
jgi:hypothetical protein